jgi:hypothetical protein
MFGLDFDERMRMSFGETLEQVLGKPKKKGRPKKK